MERRKKDADEFRCTPKYMQALGALYGNQAPPKPRTAKTAKPKIPTEYQEAVLLCDYCSVKRIPIVHIPNEGRRSNWEGLKMQRTGLSRGFPDYLIPLARSTHGALFIELKRKSGGTVSEDQRKWLAYLAKQGYKVCVAQGADEAIKLLEEYLALPIASPRSV